MKRIFILAAILSTLLMAETNDQNQTNSLGQIREKAVDAMKDFLESDELDTIIEGYHNSKEEARKFSEDIQGLYKQFMDKLEEVLPEEEKEEKKLESV